VLTKVEFEYLYLEDHLTDFYFGCHAGIFTGEKKCPYHKTVRKMEEKILSSDGIYVFGYGYNEKLFGSCRI
jgi:hypothetical protein